MEKWVRYLLIAALLLILTLAFLFVPISDYLDFLTGWDSTFAILSFITTVIFGIIGLQNRRKQQEEDGGSSQTITKSPIHGNNYGPGASHIEQTLVNPDPLVIQAKEDQAARLDYLKQLNKFCQNLLLVPLGEEDTAGASVHLDDVYIDLNTSTPLPQRKSPKTRNTLEHELISFEPQKTYSALQVVQRNEKLVILGDPGSGKSTFAKRLLGLIIATEINGKDLHTGLPPGLLPVFVNLRDLVPRLQKMKLLDDTELLSRQLAEVIVQQAEHDTSHIHQTPSFIRGMRAALKGGHCYLVLDGFDEVPQKMRALVRESVAGLMRCYHIQRLLVTCRIRSYEGDAILEAFPAHTLALLTDEQIRKFCFDWYKRQSEIGRVEIQAYEGKAKDLADNAIQDEKLKELAENPMLLTSMAIVHQRDTKLPRERVKLLKEVVGILLLRWQQHHGNQHLSDPLKAFLKDEDLVWRSIEHLAFKAHRAGQGVKEAADLPRKYARDILEEHYLPSAGLAEEFLDYIDQRSGILTGRGGEISKPGSYAFPHRTFQEYLAGCHLASAQDPYEMVDQFRDIAAEGDFWDVAALMAYEELKHNRPSLALRFLAYELRKECDLDSSSGHRMVMWSGQMASLFGREVLERSDKRGVAYLQALQPDLRIAAQSSLLNPVERAEAANTLDQLGWEPEDLYQFIEIPRDDKYATFWLGKYAVTNVQYQRFLTEANFSDHALWCHFPDYDPDGILLGDTGQSGWQWLQESLEKSGQTIVYPRYWNNVLFGNSRRCSPVVGINWYEANAYCRWLQRAWNTLEEAEARKGWQPQLVRLPLEKEWKLAAGEIGNDRFPWDGENKQTDLSRILHCANTYESGIGKTTPVWMYPQGSSHPFGFFDMAGNVWEWQLNRYTNDDKNPDHAVRGGSFIENQDNAHCTYRHSRNRGGRDNDCGFRVCLSPIRSVL